MLIGIAGTAAAVRKSSQPGIRGPAAEDVAKIAVGPEHFNGRTFSELDAILYEIIGGDVFGADRMDYLLRDSHHAGVAYGRFDHYRLIDTMRALPKEHEETDEPALGVEEGALQSAESLLWARNPEDQARNLESVQLVHDALAAQFGAAAIRRDHYAAQSSGQDFPVRVKDGRIASSLNLSETLQHVPTFSVDYVFVSPDLRETAKRWLENHRSTVIPGIGAG